jgi:hypothetical protein
MATNTFEYFAPPLDDAPSLHPQLGDIVLLADECAAQVQAFMACVAMTADAHPDSAPLRMLSRLATATTEIYGAGAMGILEEAYALQRDLDAQQGRGTDDGRTDHAGGAR